MTAIVSGDSLGLGSTSLATLGRFAAQDGLSSAAQGRNGERVVVNASTGNLVLQDRDDLLVGRGLDIDSLRTYNSQGLLDDDNADNWRVGAFGQTVRLASGSAGAAGSTVVRTDRDGSASVYTWNATRNVYVGTDGAGAHDTITFDAGAAQFVWTDGDSGRIERFQGSGAGRLVSASDANGNTVTLGYDAAGRPTSMVDANGDTQFYDYDGNDLSRIRTVSGGATTTTVRYGYDAAHRLVRVTVDLTPEDNAVADGKVYETAYAYDGTSRRVARIDQTDGSSLAFTYVQDGSAFKVASVTDALGAVTRFTYDRINGITTVTDALGGQSTYRHDTQGRLTELKSGIGSANPQGLRSQRFAYDADGNVTQITDGTGHTLSVQYDANGNAVREVDSAGDTRVRSFGSANQLLIDTAYADAAVHRGAFDNAAALPESTRFVYANANARQLRFSVGPAGSVTEHRYDGNGLRTASIVYTAASFDVSALAPGAAPTEAQLLAWVQARDATQTERTDFAYDARGQLTRRTTYEANDASGNGQLAGAAITRYVRDARGLLLQQIEADGAVTQYTYDGLGRELSRNAPSRDAATPSLTLTRYDDAGRSTTVTLANGLVTLSAYDRAGRLVGITQSSQGTGALGTTRYAYDAVGHLLMTTDPTGARRWSLYDAAGREVADIDATGAMVENVFDASGRLRQTIAYAARIDIARLVDASGLPTTAGSSTAAGLTLAALRPVASGDDRKTWRFYDAANRLAWEVDAAGYATQTTYDGESRVLAVTRLATAIDVDALEAAAALGLDPIFAVDQSTVGGLTLQASTATPSVGTALTLTATVGATDAAAGGMVSFFDGDTLIGSATVADGKASFTTLSLAVGAHAIRAAYSGDADRAASLSGPTAVSVTPALTQARIALSPGTATFGVTATISATLSTPDAPTLAAATGRVTFYNGNVVLGSANAVNGVAQINYSTLSGALSIRIVYAGDTMHAPLTTTVSLGTAAPRQTVTTLIPPSAGTGGVLSASVLGGWNLQPVSGGTVTFYSGTTVIGTATAASGKASLTLKTPPPAGPFKAVYGASSTHATSSSAAGPAASTTTLQVSAGPLAGQTQLQARVTGASPSGLVSFFADTVYLGSASYVSGVATLTTSAIPVGTNALRAAYGGDANDRGSVSAAAVPLAGAAGTTVAPAPTVVTTGIGIAASATAGAGYAAQITVTGLGANATGVLSLFDGQTLVGSFTAANGVFGTISSPALAAGTHALRVVYSGDATRPATVATASVTVSRSTPGLSLSSSNKSAVTGTAVTLVASLYLPNRIGYGGPAPSGKVTFYNKGVSIGSATLANGEARLTLTNLATGVANITAVYAGDTQFATATSSALPQIVAASAQAAASLTSIEVVPQNAQAGIGANLKLRVAPAAGATAAAVEGQVALYDGSRLLGSAGLVAGMATFDQNLLPVGNTLLRAEYVGNASFAPSTNLVSTQIFQALSRTTLSATPTSAAQGASVTLTAAVSGATPGGTVSFFAGTTFLGAATVTGGRAVLTTQALPAGQPTVVATYSGDANNRSSVSTAGVSFTVAPGTPVAPPVVTAGGFTFGFVDATAGFANGVTTSLPASATGSLSFFDGQTLIGSLTLGTAGNRAIVLPTGGSRTFTVVYSGDATYAAASATQTVAVQQLKPELTLDSNAQVALPGAPLVLRVRVAPPGGTAIGNDFAGAAATGKVSFSANGVVLGTGTLTGGVATFNLASLPAGTTAFSVAYAGDANYQAGTATFTQSVSTAQQTPTVSLAPLPARIGYGSSLTLTASITSRGLPPSGTVRFYDGSTLIGSATVAQGAATLRISTLGAGSHSISASYAGDAGNVAASLLAPVRVEVTPLATSVSRQSAASIASDAAIRIAVGGSSATGIVGIYDGQTLLATARVVAGVATLSEMRWPVGTRTLTAAYSGDAKNASASLRFTQTVTGQSPAVVRVQLDAIRDRATTRFIDSQGRLQGMLDAEGYLTEYRYDAAGRLIETIAYATPVADIGSAAERSAAVAVARASGKLTGLRPAESVQDIRTLNIYDARGQQVGQIDAEGFLTENSYDSRGQLVRSTRYARPVDELAAGAANATLAGIRPPTDPLDQTVTQSWDAAGQLVSRTNAEGTVSQFVYGSVGQLVQTTTAVGTADATTTRARYDVQGRLLATLDGRGSDAVALADPLAAWAAKGDSFSYDAAGRRTSSTDANGRRTLYFYDAESRLAFAVNPLGEVTQTVYDAFGGVAQQIVYGTRIDAPTLARSTAGGIALNAVVAAVAAVANAANAANAAKDSRTQFSYGRTGTLASRTNGLGQVTRYDYNAFGDTTSSRRTLSDGRQVTDAARFDRRGMRVAHVQDAEGLALTQSSRYDAFGRTVVATDGNGQSSIFNHDRMGRLIGTLDATGAFTTTRYDAFSRTVAHVDALGRTTTYAYDLQARSLRVTTPEGIVTTTVHDRLGRTTSITDGLGNVTSYRYDKSGNLVETKTPLTSTTSTFDAVGQQLQSVDANGIPTAYTYDAVGRVLTRTLDPQGLSLRTRTEYDAKGQAVRVTDPRGTVTSFEFDLEGRVLRQTVDPTGLALQTVYTHDTDGRTLSVTTPGGTLTRYTYDSAGRRTAEQVDPLGLNLTRRYAYDANGNVTQAIDANGNATHFTYDREDRLLFTLDAAGSLTQNRYDAAGHLVQQTRYTQTFTLAQLSSAPPAIDAGVAAGTGLTTQWRYDGDGRLRFAVDPTGAVTRFGYDAAGNRIEALRYANRIDPAGLAANSDPTLVADAAQDQRVRTGYDALNRPTWQVDATGAVVLTVYDAAGRVTESRSFANFMSASALAAWNGRSAPTVAADAARDLRLRTVYDAAGRATWNVDAGGNVTRRVYDADGNVLEQRAFATPLTAAALAAWGGRVAPAPVPDDAHDLRARNEYDRANRLSWSVDGAGSLTHLEYDGSGNITRRTVQYESIDYDSASLSVAGSPNDASAYDQITDYIYDGANRLRHQVRHQASVSLNSEWFDIRPGMREVTSFVYDGVGHLTRQTDYAQLLYEDPVFDEAGALVTRIASAELDRTRFMTYDAAGQLEYQVDGVGAVTRNSYDGAGRLVRTQAYSRAIATAALQISLGTDRLLAASGNDIAARVRADAAADRITAMAYDGNGRRTFTVDALGSVSGTVYDAFGNVIRQTGYATAIAAPTASTVYADAALRSTTAAGANAANDRVQRFAYDQAGRLAMSVDAMGAVTESTYDGVGHETKTRRYARAIDTAGLGSSASVTGLRTRITPDATNDRVTQRAFDATGRQVYGVDALGYVTRFVYDGVGRNLSTTQYAKAIFTGTPATVAAIGAAVVWNSDDRTVTDDHDAAGRVISRVDAMGFTEAWGYNAYGHRISYTNAKGSQWRYANDLAGRVIIELSPEVDVTAVAWNGGLQPGTLRSSLRSSYTLYTYDAFGNLTSRTEPPRVEGRRATYYEYDRVGRQTRVMYPTVGVDTGKVGATAAAVDPGRDVQWDNLFTETTYDALGNAVSSLDIGGHRSYKAYDLAGRVAYDVDALGSVTQYQRNAFGDTVSLTRLATATMLVNGQPARLSRAQLEAPVNAMRSDSDRTLTTVYDRLGRAIEVTEPPVFGQDPTLAVQSFNASKVTRNTYDSFGQRIQVAQKKDGAAGTWTVTTSFFDKRGQQVASVDAMGYATRDQFDAAGNVVAHTEYANAVAGWTASSGLSTLAGWTGAANAGALGAAPTPVLSPGNDRTTNAAYDRNNRKTSETRLNVEYSAAADGSARRGDLTTRYGWDAVGNQTVTTDALGGQTTSHYDALGRVTAVTGPSRSTVNSAGVETTFTPLTVFKRDEYGNVIDTTEYINGAWNDEGVSGYLASSAGTDRLPLFRLVSTSTGAHVYSTSAQERDGLVASGAWRDEGALGYLDRTGAAPGTKALYWLVMGADSIYTTDPAEVARAVSSGWATKGQNNGVMGYVGAQAGSAFGAGLHRFYNPSTGEHFYTTDPKEATKLASTPAAPNPLAAPSRVPFTDIAIAASQGFSTQLADLGFIGSKPFLGSRPLYELQGTLFSTIYAYTSNEAEVQSDVASGAWANRRIVGYVSSKQTADTVPMYRLRQFASPLSYTKLVTNPGEIAELKSEGWTIDQADGADWVVGYVRNVGYLWGNATYDTLIRDVRKPVPDNALGGENHRIVRVDQLSDPRNDIDLVANSDRTSLSQYDALGRLVESIDAMGVHHYRSYNRQGLLAREWQWVAGEDGIGHILFRGYAYDALGQQTHIYDPALATDGMASAKTVSTIIPTISHGVAGTGPTISTNGLVVNPGGQVRVTMDYIGVDTTVPSADGDVLVPGHAFTYVQTANASAAGTMSIMPPEGGAYEPVGWVKHMRLEQEVSPGKWKVLWSGTPAGASGGVRTMSAVQASGLLTVAPLAEVLLPASPPLNGMPSSGSELGGVVIINAANVVANPGGEVRLSFDYHSPTVTSVRNVGPDQSDIEITTPAHWQTQYAAPVSAAAAQQPQRIPADEPIDSVDVIRVQQKDANGTWVTVWEGTPAEANGQVVFDADTTDSAVGVIDTAMQYNAFGELVNKGVNGGRQEYFDYDNAGQLWRTNAGDGVDKVALYDLQGHQTAQIVSGGQGRADLDLHVYGNAAAVADLTEVRRTDTRYDLLGRVVQQALPERLDLRADGTSVYQRPVIVQNTDRWGNVVSITDPRSTAWKTTYRYNANNQMVMQVQTNSDGVAGVQADGSLRTDAPVTRLYYDALGRQVAVRDANDHVNGSVFDSAGQLVRELHADGGVVRHVYNAFGNRVKTIDAVGNAGEDPEEHATVYTFDHLNRLLRTRHVGTNVVDTSTWDEAGRKLSQTNGEGETIRYAYDLRGNLVLTTLPMGQSTLALYDVMNRKAMEIDANGAVATWQYTHFGQLAGHSDIGGARYSYTYDNARQLTGQRNTRGQNLAYGYDAAGQVLAITDGTVGTLTNYRYDLSGRRVRESTKLGGITYQDNVNAYDALGRMRSTGDTRSTVAIDYDLAGNRSLIKIHLNSDALNRDSERHYKYDSMNRQTVVDALDPEGVNLGADGHRLSYDLNGNRVSDAYNGTRILADGKGGWTSGAGLVQETYAYDTLDRLSGTLRDGAQIDARTYDAASRVLTSGTALALDLGLGAPGYALHYLAATNSALQVRTTEYDDNGRVRLQDTSAIGYSALGGRSRTKTTVNYDQYDAAGNLAHYQSVTLDFDSNKISTSPTVNTFVRQEGYKLQSTDSANAGEGGWTGAGMLSYGYDANGHLVRTTDVASLRDTREHHFVNDASGTALYAYYGSNPVSPQHAQRQLVVNGEVLGRYGEESSQRSNGIVWPEASFSAQSRYSFGFEPINGNYPADTPGSYAVGQSDTLQGIAKGAYGDASLWYLIADANGLGSNADLRIGQILTIPVRASSANNAGTFKPYDPSQIVGEISPTMMAVPHDKGGCGVVGQIVVTVVAVVVAAFTQQWWLLTYGGGAAASTGAVIASGAIGGAAGSIVSQGVGIAIGAQDSFSWKGVALGALAGGVAAGVGGVGLTDGSRVGGIAGLNGAGLGSTIARAAVTNAATEGIAVATGLQDKFNWKAVAASAIGAGVGTAVGGALNSTNPFGTDALGQFANRAVSGLAGGFTTVALRGGKVNATQAAVDAFGNVLGESIASANSSGGYNTPAGGEALGYRNGMDVQDDLAVTAADRAWMRRQNEMYDTTGDIPGGGTRDNEAAMFGRAL